MANNRVNRITFQQLQDNRERGIVCNEAMNPLNEWQLDEAEENLIVIVDNIIERIDQRGELTDYYIGKAFVDQEGQNFNQGNPATWNLAGINGHWVTRWEEEGYNGLIVLAVIGRDEFNHDHSDYQDFALALKQRLIHHYWIDRDSGTIRNDNFREGLRGDRGQQERDQQHRGYAVYMAVRIQRQRGEGGGGGGEQGGQGGVEGGGGEEQGGQGGQGGGGGEGGGEEQGGQGGGGGVEGGGGEEQGGQGGGGVEGGGREEQGGQGGQGGGGEGGGGGRGRGGRGRGRRRGRGRGG